MHGGDTYLEVVVDGCRIEVGGLGVQQGMKPPGPWHANMHVQRRVVLGDMFSQAVLYVRHGGNHVSPHRTINPLSKRTLKNALMNIVCRAFPLSFCFV